MLNRREVATIAWYGALFSAVVGWAMLRQGAVVAPALRNAADEPEDERGAVHRVARRIAGP